MQQTLITNREFDQGDSRRQGQAVSFRQCIKASEGKAQYQIKLFFLLAAYWICASFFIALPFFLFKKPIYCEKMSGELMQCCEEGDQKCVQNICHKYANDILNHVKPEDSLTYTFQIFCGNDWVRVIFKVLPETLSFVGFLLYGTVADVKGRQTASKISWRMFAVGVIIFSTAQAKFLKIFGYMIASIHCLPCLMIQFVLFFQLNINKQKNRESLLLLACLFVGPFALSFFSGLIIQIDNRYVIGVLCALPVFIMSLLINKIVDSAVFFYPTNKPRAFGIINFIAKENNQLPIMIDLSKSSWLKKLTPKTNFISLVKARPIGTKMFLGFFFMFSATFNVKVAQVSLDDYTETSYRSLLVNIPTTLADITLCLLLPMLKKRTCRFLNLALIFLIISMLAFKQVSYDFTTQKTITIIHAVAIRYLSQLCYDMLIIWSIETFPTICRGYCVGFVLCGWAVGCLGVYLLKDFIEVAYVIALLSTTLAFVSEGYLNFNGFGVMLDTLDGKYYDEDDTFYKT